MSRENEPAAEQAEDIERAHEREGAPGRREGEPAAEQARDVERGRDDDVDADAGADPPRDAGSAG